MIPKLLPVVSAALGTRYRPSAKRRMTCALALLLMFAGGVTAEDRWYRVELLAFSQRGAEQLEQWPASPALAYPDGGLFLQDGHALALPDPQVSETNLVLKEGEELRGNLPAFHALPSERRDFNSVAESMARSSRYRVLFHETWAQPVPGKRRALPLILDRSGDTGEWPELQGSVKIYLGRYLHLETNLWLNTQGSYLPGDWRMPPPPLGPPSDGSAQVTETAPSEAAAPSQFGGDDYYWQQDEIEDEGSLYPFRHAVALQQKRRMRSKDIHYIDHPMLGLLIKFTPLVSPEPVELSAAD